ncbi:MAG: BtpA/SgcQ family protein [Acidobacteria bacterium]|nr:MAG: BtpA/SgcQ family protein [Acidobacteriota bacterium]
MVHLLPLPGSPGFNGSMDEIMKTAVSDASDLAEAGFPALMIENFGDVPFLADGVPAETISAMTVSVTEVSDATGLPFGVNVLRNDAVSALGIAAATGAAFIRVNVLTGIMYTDQGPIVGQAAAVLRKRSQLAPGVEIWADVMVKHAAAPAEIDASQAAADTVERGRADAVIVSGSGTGAEPDMHEATVVRAAVPTETRVVIGSGANVDNLSRLTGTADSVIVGSSIKVDGDARNRVDPRRASRFIEAARDDGLL